MNEWRSDAGDAGFGVIRIARACARVERQPAFGVTAATASLFGAAVTAFGRLGEDRIWGGDDPSAMFTEGADPEDPPRLPSSVHGPAPKKSIRVALYARVSKVGPEQDPTNQLLRLRAHAQNRDLAVYAEFVDRISGVRDRRPELERLMRDVRGHRVAAVLAVRLDRLGRSTLDLLRLFEEFEAAHVAFIAIDQNINTTTPVGRYLRTNLAAIAELEREFIRERTKDGLARARAQGHRPGRPRKLCVNCGAPREANLRAKKKGRLVPVCRRCKQTGSETGGSAPKKGPRSKTGGSETGRFPDRASAQAAGQDASSGANSAPSSRTGLGQPRHET